METAVAEVRSVVHSLGREVLQNATVSFPEVQKLMETRVVALLTTREEKENALKDGRALACGGQKETITVDVFQGSNIPSNSDIVHTNFFARCTVVTRCKECSGDAKKPEVVVDKGVLHCIVMR
jgi:hypothetical protein